MPGHALLPSNNKLSKNHIVFKNKIVLKRIIVLVGLCATVFYASCNSEKKESEEATKYVVTSPLRKDTTITKDYVCQIHAIQHIEVRALERGYLQNIYVDEGQMVRKGQMMFQIMPMLYQAEQQKAQAEASFAEIEYLNTKSLADSNIVSPNELALAKAKLNKAKAELSLAQVHLGFTEIRAPFSGIMDHFQVRLGSLVDEGDLLTTLSDNSKLWVYFNVPEAEYLNLEGNLKKEEMMKVKLLMANQEQYPYDGHVETIEADFNNETGNIAFRAVFENPDGLLRHGETGNIQIDAPFKNALIIPQKATFEVLEKKYVFVVDKNKVAHQREVTIAGEVPDLYFIAGGLKEGDKIIVEGIRKVRNNEKIEFTYEQPEKIIANLKVAVE